MLTRLTIKNIVLIEEAEIAFASGLNVLTGETGAGKSILLDALGLVLGRRAEKGLVRAGAEQAVVAAEFSLAGHAGVEALLDEQGLPKEETLLLRRVLNRDGGGRAFINGEAVGVATLRALGEMLVEIHGQHDQRGLMDASTHAATLDRFGGLEEKRAEVAKHFAAWRSAIQAREALEESLEAAKREEEYLRHMAGELSKLAPQEGEEAALTEARMRMMQNEKMASLLKEGLEALQDGDRAAIAMLRNLHRTFARSSLNVEGRFDALLEAFDRAQHELGLAEDALETLARGAEYDAGALERMEERLFAIKAAARKYQTESDALPAKLEEVEAKLATLSRQDKELAAAQKAEAEARASYLAAAEVLGKARKPVAVQLAEAIHAELAPLKMGATRFSVAQEALPESGWHAGGIEALRFEVATNAGSTAGPLGKIASGGELSRLMLALKVILADGPKKKGKAASSPTLIFDEIDTGTGGATADAIGTRLATLGERCQVLVVTHLPQVAAKGAHHLKIEKEEAKGHTRTQVTELSAPERKQELARMLSGADVTKEALSAAGQLLKARA